jgi:hypothetical protein
MIEISFFNWYWVIDTEAYIGTYIGNSTDRRRGGPKKKNEPEMMKQPGMKDPLGPSTTRIGIMYTGENYLNAYLIINIIN